ncbi:MAG: helix-turn-helix transcriptional regulator [Phycisphaerales bacterium]|nr:helix-turn-helix transcriptional regulator [Phycisphaerales bacterium]MCB9858606.1 helix-turn-helix transcriptional regulator [Phycisphaerales bacterium]
MAGKSNRNPTMTELLRQALRDCESLNAVEKATGVKRQTLAKFMRGEQTIRLDSADLLAAHFHVQSGHSVT